MTILYKKEFIIPLFMLIILLLLIIEPNGYDFIALALSSLLLSYAGFLRRKNILDKISIGLGLVLFLVFCILFIIK